MNFDGVTPQKLLALCEDFLTIDRRRNVWELAHTSVREYFQDKHWGAEGANLLVSRSSLWFLIDLYATVDVVELNRASIRRPTTHAADTRNNKHISEEQGERPVLDPERARRDLAALQRPLPSYINHHWPYHVKDYDAKIKPGGEANAQLSSLLKRLFKSPEESSLEYRRWIDYIRLSRDNNDSFTSPPRSSPFHLKGDIDIHDLTPARAALFGMCRFGLYHLLVDWWEKDLPDDLVKERTKNGANALANAAMAGAPKPMLERLIQKIDVNRSFKKTKGGYMECGSVLTAAITHGRYETAKFLIENAGAKVNALVTGWRYESALVAAAARSTLEFCRWLVEDAGASIHPMSSSTGQSPLSSAARAERLDIMQYLVQAGAKVNAVLPHLTACGSALSAAASGTNTEAVRYLLKCGAEPDLLLPGIYGSALATAAFFGKISIMEVLIRAGADVNLQLTGGWYGSALAATAIHDWPEAMLYLINQGADVNQELEAGEFGSALVYSICCHHWTPRTALAKLLLDAGAMPNTILKRGCHSSGLAAAAFWGELDLLQDMVTRVTPTAALKALQQSSPPPVKSRQYFHVKVHRILRCRGEVSRYLVEDLGLEAEYLLQIGLEIPPEASTG